MQMSPEAMSKTEKEAEPSEPLLELEKGAVICLCGAGGKTTLLHRLAEHSVRKGFRTLATTTTHMRVEEGLCSDTESVRQALDRCGYAFAGKPDRKNPAKIESAPEEELLQWESLADVTIIEADGARERCFKVPHPWEPVIPDNVTRIAVLYGRRATGGTIGGTAYNAEGVCRILQENTDEYREVTVDTILTEEMMRRALEESYVKPLRQKYPQARIGIIGIGPKGGK